jgi:hypothetical protein
MMNKMNAGSATVDSRATLVVAGAALVILTIAYGAPLLSAVALKPIAAEFGTERAWMLAGRQKRFARYGAGAAALAGYASALALPNATHVCPVGDGGGLRRRRDVEHRSCCSALPAAACFKWQFALSVNLLLVVS